MDDPQRAMKIAGATRWLSRETSVHGINDTLPSLLKDLRAHSDKATDAMAIGLSHLTHDYRFIATTAILNDVLPVIGILSKTMQKDAADFTLLVDLVPVVKATLEDMKHSPGTSYKELPLRLGETGDLSADNFDIRFRHEDNIVHKSVQRSIYLALLSRLIEQLDERFPDYDFLKALVVLFGPDSLRSEAAQSADYGEEELAFVLDHYGRALQKNDLSNRVRLEWRTAGDNPELGGAAAAHEVKQADEEEGLVIPSFADSKMAKLEWALARRTLIARVQAWSGEEPMRVADLLAILVSTTQPRSLRWVS
jgi:hypothetical protein